MVTIGIGAYSQAQGILVGLQGDTARVNIGGRIVEGRLITPRDRLPVPMKAA